MTDTSSALVPLAQTILKLAQNLSPHFENSLKPGAQASGQPVDEADVQSTESLRGLLNDAARDIINLVNGPAAVLRQLFFSHYDLAALQVALERKFFQIIPVPEPTKDGAASADGVDRISVDQIAEQAGMDVDRTRRILKILATQRIFEELEGDKYRHTPISIPLAAPGGMNSVAAMQMDEMFKAASETADTIAAESPGSIERKSAFQHRFNSSMYDFYEQNPAKGVRFAEVMRTWSKMESDIVALRNAFDWASLGDGQVIDVGGGNGHISIALAREFPTLRFLVQDISSQMLTAQDASTLSSRINFEQHNFFTPQPIREASALLIRQCLHNYNDADCVKILSGIVPALERSGPNTPLIINDIIMPERSAVSRYEEHLHRQVDICMMVTLDAKQRTRAEFEELLVKADSRFEIRSTYVAARGVGVVVAYLRSRKRSVDIAGLDGPDV